MGWRLRGAGCINVWSQETEPRTRETGNYTWSFTRQARKRFQWEWKRLLGKSWYVIKSKRVCSTQNIALFVLAIKVANKFLGRFRTHLDFFRHTKMLSTKQNWLENANVAFGMLSRHRLNYIPYNIASTFSILALAGQSEYSVLKSITPIYTSRKPRTICA